MGSGHRQAWNPEDGHVMVHKIMTVMANMLVMLILNNDDNNKYYHYC